LLLLASAKNRVPDGHRARFVGAVVDELNLSTLDRADKGRGSLPNYPAMGLSLLIYRYPPRLG